MPKSPPPPLLEVLISVRETLAAADTLRDRYERLIRAVEAVNPHPITTADRLPSPPRRKAVHRA